MRNVDILTPITFTTIKEKEDAFSLLKEVHHVE